MKIKRNGKLFEIVDGIKVVNVYYSFEAAQKDMPLDKKEYTNKSLDDSLCLEFEAFTN